MNFVFAPKFNWKLVSKHGKRKKKSSECQGNTDYLFFFVFHLFARPLWVANIRGSNTNGQKGSRYPGGPLRACSMTDIKMLAIFSKYYRAFFVSLFTNNNCVFVIRIELRSGQPVDIEFHGGRKRLSRPTMGVV